MCSVLIIAVLHLMVKEFALWFDLGLLLLIEIEHEKFIAVVKSAELFWEVFYFMSRVNCGARFRVFGIRAGSCSARACGEDFRCSIGRLLVSISNIACAISLKLVEAVWRGALSRCLVQEFSENLLVQCERFKDSWKRDLIAILDQRINNLYLPRLPSATAVARVRETLEPQSLQSLVCTLGIAPTVSDEDSPDSVSFSLELEITHAVVTFKRCVSVSKFRRLGFSFLRRVLLKSVEFRCVSVIQILIQACDENCHVLGVEIVKVWIAGTNPWRFFWKFFNLNFP